MASKAKSHKAMSDSEWMSRLSKFANTGVWPSGEGNRPAPRQKKWYELYQRIEKCPMQSHGQTSLFGGLSKCSCRFHTKKPASSSVQQMPGQQPAEGPIRETVGQQHTAESPIQATVEPQPATAKPVHSALGQHQRSTSLSLQMFTKPRFGGSHVSAAKPNLGAARKTIQTHATSPTGKVSSTPPPCTTVLSQVPSTSASSGPIQTCSTDSTSHEETISTVSTPSRTLTGESPSAVQLPRLWSEGLPPEDHKWIASVLFKMGARGKPELRDNLQLWYHPPQPSLLYHQAPAPDRFFSHSLLVWMPYRLWKVKVVCPNPACRQHQLTGAGMHKRARRVLDIDRVYNMVTETLICTKCRASHVSWSQTVLQQLDLAHRSEFRVILTYKYACDVRVIRLLRERGLGNSPTRVLKQLKENHTEEWLHRVARYTTECVDFLNRPSLLPITFPEPPEPAIVPSCKWLLAVYSQDILTRLEDVKARITSTYGFILKLDSTKKMTRKLAGTARGTALWVTSVGNEIGQVLISVLTAQEGSGLDMMADGLVKRYQQAGVDPPAVLYVDCGCCTQEGETKLQTRFGGWPDLIVRLDIWHFMRRLAVGCSTDAHQLYPVFMSRLSSCLFEWDAADVALLRRAKRQLLMSQGLHALTDSDLNKNLTKEELALHCRRRTRGKETTIQLIEQLLQELMGTNGNDSLGVPLFDFERMEHVWAVQKKHVKCIQDPLGVALYAETGSLTKGGVLLKTYRCARGSTSLESFHLHLNRFIPGTSANSLNFQIYLLEGLHRWNQDRATASLSSEPPALRSYTGDLVHCVNKNYEKLFGRKMVKDFNPPACYTGELIGIQYLFRQTGQALQDMHPDSEETAKLLEEHDVEDITEEDEGFQDLMEDPTLNLAVLTSSPSTSVVTTIAPSTSTTHSGSSTSTISSSTSTISSSTSTISSSTSSISTLPASTSFMHLAPSSVAPGPSETPEAVTESRDDDMAVDEQNMPGFQHVDRLAKYLVELREQTSLYLTNQQVNVIIDLWKSLNEEDKKRVVYAARHQKRLLSGRFRTQKKPTQISGVESTIRCVLGANSTPAQWPDCCRLVETIFIRLCNIYPSPKRKGKGALSRWSLILRDYHKIRQLVLGNSLLMQESTLQLVEVNQTTLLQWYNNRVKRQELSVLLQGTTLPQQVPEATEPLPEARTLPSEKSRPQHEHQYSLPESTAGQARQRPISSGPQPIRPKPPMERQLIASSTVPKPSIQIMPFIIPGTAFQTSPVGQAFPIVHTVPILQQPSTQQPTTPSTSGAIPKRAYRRTVAANTCKKCGQFRTNETGHSQFRGRVFCPQVETVSREEWLSEMRTKFPKDNK